MSFLRVYGPAAAAGVAAALAFPFLAPGLSDRPLLEALPRELLALAWGAYLHHLAASQLAWRAVARRGWAAGAAFFAVLIFWLDIAMTRFGGMPHWQALPALVLLVAYCALYWAAAPLAARWLRARAALPLWLGLALAVVWLEWLRGLLFGGFPWGAPAYAQARNLPLVQLAWLGGASLVSAVVIALGALAQQAAARRTGRALAAAGAALLLSHAPGALRLALGEAAGGETVEVALLQGSIPQSIKSKSAEHRALIHARYSELTQRAVAQGAEVVLWPEAAWPTRLAPDAVGLPGYTPGIELVVGAATITYEPAPRATNSAFSVTAAGAITGRYDKVHLVPFGEYVPLGWLLPVEKLVPGFLDFSAGEVVEPLGTARFGVLICYDGIFADVARAHVRAGARVLANLSNDAWYGRSSAPFQHRDFYVLRAVETDRWAVRATNSGVSSFIDPLGRRSEETELDAVAIAQRAVQLRDTRTPAVLLGDWVVLLASAVLLSAIYREGRARLRARAAD